MRPNHIPSRITTFIILLLSFLFIHALEQPFHSFPITGTPEVAEKY